MTTPVTAPFAAYLDAFREASEREGRRLLDVLDVHWYAFHDRGDLFRSIRPEPTPRVYAPRTLTSSALFEILGSARLSHEAARPILPHSTLCARRFPGVRLAVTEFNYGGAEDSAAGLAVVDALGRFGAAGVHFASHWGSLAGWLGEAASGLTVSTSRAPRSATPDSRFRRRPVPTSPHMPRAARSAII